MSPGGVAAVAIALAVALGAIALGWRTQRRTSRRLLDVLERLGDPVPRRARSEAVVDWLERSVDRIRRHDEQVQLAEERLELALGELTQGAVICDADGQILLRNSFARTFAEARHGEALVEAAIDDLLAVARRGEHAEREMELFGPPRRVLALRAAPLRRGGMLLGAIAIIDDISEQQRIDTIRRDFVANVSHELKTPIGALALLAETLAGEREPAVVARLSERVRDEAFRVSRMVDELLTLSRVEGEPVAARERFPVASMVEEAVEQVRHAAEQAGVPLIVDPVDPTLEVEGDRRQLTSAVFNLLENAVKYSDAGRPVEVRVTPADDRVTLAVRDHGIGIPSRDLDRIFERFYRVDKARSRATGGTGLGLSIVRHTVRNHGGDVHVESREGEGSTFTVVLPAGTAPPDTEATT